MMHADVSLDTAKQYIQALDLMYIADYMSSTHYILPRWTLANAKHCITLYKNFLYLQKKHPEDVLVPTREIDECWHNHILYTKQYHHDCMNIFGHYLHHTPVVPGEADAQLVSDYLKTKNLYFDEFNASLDLIRLNKDK